MVNVSNSYDYPPFRPPNEGNSALIRITRGCPWNRCEFCSMYKSIRFEIKSIEIIREEIQTARHIYGSAETIFIGDSDNLAHNNLAEIVSFIRETFPEAKRITTYARAKTILGRKMDFLKTARKSGLNRLHLGLESGDKLVLERLQKGINPQEMIQAGIKAKQAGFEVSFYVLSGAGGQDRWKEHALHSAAVLNTARPDYIRLRTLTVQHQTPLGEKLAAGEFICISPKERMQEVKLLLENLRLQDCFLASDHMTNFLWADHEIVYRGITGQLPGEKPRMLETLNRIIEFLGSTNRMIKNSNQLYQEGAFSRL